MFPCDCIFIFRFCLRLSRARACVLSGSLAPCTTLYRILAFSCCTVYRPIASYRLLEGHLKVLIARDSRSIEISISDTRSRIHVRMHIYACICIYMYSAIAIASRLANVVRLARASCMRSSECAAADHRGRACAHAHARATRTCTM